MILTTQYDEMERATETERGLGSLISDRYRDIYEKVTEIRRQIAMSWYGEEERTLVFSHFPSPPSTDPHI